MRARFILFLATALIALPGAAKAEKSASRAKLAERARAVLGVLPPEAASESNRVTEPKVVLGRLLYYDTRLSKNHDVSCDTCHPLAEFGVDHLSTSTGHRGQRGGRNAPTVYNAAFHVAQFWDGRAADVEEQAKGPVLNPIEMAMPSEEAVVRVLRSIPGYEPLFRAAFPDTADPVDYDNMARAIGAFERRLVTPSRFDAFLTGDLEALRGEEISGLQRFLDTGCPTCHSGAALGGALFQKLGVVKPYPTEDTGRLQATGREEDRFVFKVPSLRNVAETAPYFHDGSVPKLEEAVRKMAEFQLGKSLTGAEVQQITSFLRSLTGKVDGEYTREPQLPPSGPSTPKPDPT